MRGGFGALAYGVAWLGGFAGGDHDLLTGVSANDHHPETHTHAGAVTREGGNTTEATTTSTTAVDLLTASSLTIAAAEPLLFGLNTRSVTNSGFFGLKLNTTVVQEVAGSMADLAAATGGNSGAVLCYIGSRVTNYLRSATRIWSASAAVGVDNYDAFLLAADMPTAQITDVVIRAFIQTSGTAGADELQVYSLAAS